MQLGSQWIRCGDRRIAITRSVKSILVAGYIAIFAAGCESHKDGSKKFDAETFEAMWVMAAEASDSQYYKLQLPPGFQTNFHIHSDAAEVYHVLSGEGTYEYGSHTCVATQLRWGMSWGAAAGQEHRLTVSDNGPIVLLILYDKPSEKSWYREAHERFCMKPLPVKFSGDENGFQKYDQICVEN